MTAAMAMPVTRRTRSWCISSAPGLADDRYVVQRFKALADGDIRPWPGEEPATGKGRRRAKRLTASLKAVKEMRPACTEIIICTGLRTRGGMQVWGSVALGMFCDRRQRG